MLLQKAIPILPTSNIRDSIDFYEIKLGFKGTSFGNYAILNCGNVELHLVMSNPKLAFERGSCYISVSNIQDLYANYSAKDLIKPKGKLTDKPWGVMEFSISDNNGNTLHFAGKK